MKREIRIQEIKGIRIGQAENRAAGTGCTVFLSEAGMAAGLDVRGGGPASRESELLKPSRSRAAHPRESCWQAAAPTVSARQTASCSIWRSGASGWRSAPLFITVERCVLVCQGRSF